MARLKMMGNVTPGKPTGSNAAKVAQNKAKVAANAKKVAENKAKVEANAAKVKSNTATTKKTTTTSSKITTTPGATVKAKSPSYMVNAASGEGVMLHRKTASKIFPNATFTQNKPGTISVKINTPLNKMTPQQKAYYNKVVKGGK